MPLDVTERRKARKAGATETGMKETGSVTEIAATEKNMTESETGNVATETKIVIIAKIAVVSTATETVTTRRSERPMSLGLNWAWHPYVHRMKN